MTSSEPKRPRRRGPRLTRRTWALIALGLVAATLFSVLVPIQTVAYGTVLPVAMLLAGALCAAPVVAVTSPRIAIALVWVSAFVLPLVISPDRDAAWPWPWSVPALIAFAVFILVLTTLHGWRIGLVAWAVSIGASLTAPLFLPDAAEAGAASADLIVTASITAVAYLVALLLAGRIRVGEELSKERELTAQEQSRRMLVEERTRIARELHDVVAHSMSLIQVQASTARYRIPDLSAEGVTEFDDIAATARGSLAEMRRILGVLRTEDDAPQLAPQQGLTDIPTLVEGMRRAGADISLSLSAAPNDPPPSVQITAFRIVQEAVSNAVRHAPGAPITIEVGAQSRAVTVRVHNDAVADVPGASGAGHGLRGMQERVSLVAGSLMVGPDAVGGWSVTAVLPWTDADEERP